MLIQCNVGHNPYTYLTYNGPYIPSQGAYNIGAFLLMTVTETFPSTCSTRLAGVSSGRSYPKTVGTE